MGCLPCPSEAALCDHVAGRGHGRVRRHLAHCSRCRRSVARLQEDESLLNLLRAALADEALSEQERRRLTARIREKLDDPAGPEAGGGG